MPFFSFTKTTGSTSQHLYAGTNYERSLALAQFGAQQGFSVDRFAPPMSTVGTDTLIQSWIPKDDKKLNKFLRDIYTFDAIAGPAIDLITTLPFSDAVCTGIDDKAIADIYQDSINAIDVQNFMINVSKEFLVMGKLIGSMIFDSGRGIWTGVQIHDPSDCVIQPIPIRGADPKVDLIITSDVRKFIYSNDPRDVEVRKNIPPALLSAMKRGKIRLDPLATLYQARQISPKDYKGTSIFFRIIPFVVLENALLSGTVVAAHRRQRSIMHITVGDYDNWIPTPEEISSIASMFIAADEDPQGAIVATRPGVEVGEVMSGGDFWKISDEWDFLSRAKMTALGISESFLSGEVSFSTMESALSVFMESIRAFRDFLTTRIFYKKLFPIMARVHKFVKRSESEIQHRIRKGYKGKEIPEEQLLIPQIEWLKQLRPQADRDYLDILTTLEEKGLPIPLTTWATVGGLSLDRIMSMQQDDMALRKKTKIWLDAIAKSKGGGEEAFAQLSPTLDKLPIWDKQNKFLGLSKKEARDLITGKVSAEGLSEDKADAYSYISRRLGISNDAKISNKSIAKIAKHISSNTDRYSPKKIVGELIALNSIIHDRDRKQLPVSSLMDSRESKLPVSRIYTGSEIS